MIEITGDLWEQKADAICITTNGFVKKDGSAVMGRGCALEAKKRFPGIDKVLGNFLTNKGNHVYMLRAFSNFPAIVSFPVKHRWYEQADLELIVRSCGELDILTTRNGFNKVIVPRPGCGNGKLLWDDVKPRIQGILDDRFYIISN